MASQRIGTFGSEVGGKASQAPKQRMTPQGPKITTHAAAYTKAPSIHVSPLHLTEAQRGVTSSGASAGNGLTFHNGSAMLKDMTPNGAAHGSSGGSNLLGEIAGGVEGFIGNLGSDVVHTALGMPAGIAYLIQHPIAGAEGAVKATWQDWSPLFHGNVRLWLHNTYQHPLAPILDVLSVVTLGGGAAARGASIAGKLGEAADANAAVARAAASTATARAGGRFVSAATAGEAAGKAGLTESATWQKLQKFANPSRYAAKTYSQTADRLGFATPDANARFVQAAMENDGQAHRIFESAGGVKRFREMSNNPVIRARQRFLTSVGNKAAETVPGMDKLVGDQAMFRRWSTLDKGARRAALGNVIQRQLVAIHQIGATLTSLQPVERLRLMEPTMRDGLIAQSHIVQAAGAVGSKELDAQLAQLAKDGYQAIRSDESRGKLMAKAYANVADKGEAGFDQFLKKDWSKANTAKDAKDVLFDAQGNLRVVSRPGDIAKEGLFSSRAAQLLYKNPTNIWKYAILGASPRYFVNNFVGNTLMLMAATDPMSMTRAFVGFLKTSRGMNHAFTKEIERMTRGGASMEEIQTMLLKHKVVGGNWMDKWFAGEYGFGQANRINPATGHFDDKGVLATLNRKFSLHGVTHKYADMPQRYSAMIHTMHRMPEYQQAYAKLRASGMSHFAAEQRAADLAAHSPAVRTLVREQVHHMLGQYHTFGTVERSIREVIPFYAWDRAIASHMKMLVSSQPYKVAMGAAIGTLGSTKTQEILGNVPDFLLAAVPAKLLSGPLGPLAALLGKNGGRTSSLMTTGLNPYSSIADLTQLGLSVAGQGKLRAGESLGAQLNPLIQAAAQQLSGTSLQTGAPIKPAPGGPILGTYIAAFGSVPQENLVKALMGMEGGSLTKSGKPTLYAHNLQSQLSSWLGLPIRQVDSSAAKAMYDSQNHVKKPKSILNHVPTRIPGTPGA